MDTGRRRPRAHEVALAVARPVEILVLKAIALDRGCKVELLSPGLVAGVRSALMVGMRPLLEELARRMEPELFSETPLADALEPEKRPESVELVPARPPQSQRPTRPAPPPDDWEDITPLREDYPGALTGDIRRLLDGPSRTGRTLSSYPPPPPIPELLSKQLRDRKRKP